MGSWISVKNKLPRGKKQLCVFIRWHEEWQTVINEYVGSYDEVLRYREYELKNEYNFWRPLSKPR